MNCKTCQSLSFELDEKRNCPDCAEDWQRYRDYREDGHTHSQAKIMAGLADPDEEQE